MKKLNKKTSPRESEKLDVMALMRNWELFFMWPGLPPEIFFRVLNI
jgi:hypothetical protein